ncbi:MAG: divalent-cation tolerance protein CutA [Gammaproteobacteria bacterium]|nr:divalent-cation tolerance protein CutA [Gammaproteobacteria bacterium]
MSDHLLIITTLPDAAAGAATARRLVESGLAACVNIGAPVTSIYQWQGQIEQGQEVMLTIKTASSRLAAVEQAIRADHPYELPEVIAVPITAGSADYLAWIDACTTS